MGLLLIFIFIVLFSGLHFKLELLLKLLLHSIASPNLIQVFKLMSKAKIQESHKTPSHRATQNHGRAPRILMSRWEHLNAL
jgi:hypothetical protein